MPEGLGKGLDAIIPERIPEEEELKKLLKMVDGLLAKLPEDIIKEFALSKDYEFYEKVLKKYGV